MLPTMEAGTLLNDHDQAVKQIQEQVRRFAARKQRVRIYHGSTNSTRLTTFETGKFVDVSSLNHVVEINTEQRFALVEPNVPMDALVEVTLKVGLIPPVVPEFPGITIGGAVQGGAEESSSFRYGMVHDTCFEYELVLGNGERIDASPTQHADLFAGTAASYGSLGILTRIKLKLIPAKPFVRVCYERVHNAAEALELLRSHSKLLAVEYLDAILFSPTHGVIISGSLSDEVDLPVARFSRAIDEWHYLHAQTISQHHQSYQELVPIRDYLFRYDRGAFWMAKHGLGILPIPFNRLTRFVFNGITKTRPSYRFLHETALAQRFIIQDFNLPIETAHQFMAELDETVHIYPLWLCPLRPGNPAGWSANDLETELVINIGVWGPAPIDFDSFVAVNRDLERRMAALGGRKMLYAQAYYTEAEFWELYDRKHYQQLRRRYHAEQLFPTIYEKTHVTQQYTPSIWRGLWRLIKSPVSIPTQQPSALVEAADTTYDSPIKRSKAR